jgi:hypothetical protein
VVFKGAGAGDFLPAVRLDPVVPYNGDGTGAAQQTFLTFGDKLTLREGFKLFPQSRFTPGRDGGVDMLLQSNKSGNVFRVGVSYPDVY